MSNIRNNEKGNVWVVFSARKNVEGTHGTFHGAIKAILRRIV